MGVTDTLKTVWEIARQYDNAELNQEILELQGEVGDLQQATHDLEARNRELERRVEELREKLSFKRSLRAVGDVYISDGDGEWDGPFCTRCWDVNRHRVRFRDANRTERRAKGLSTAHLVCPECGSAVLKPSELQDDGD